MDLVIRPAHMGDIKPLVEFNQALARETEDRELSAQTLRSGVLGLLARPQYGFYLVAQKGNTVVGGLLITFEWSDWRDGVYWWVQSVYVRPQYRGQGVYRALYAAVKTRVAARPEVRGCRLYVEKDNLRAQAVYEKLGMKATGYQVYEELF
ncbi:MAG: GNAT family N-acetyltransferase [Candidatus Handelsmanbacteria bacterium]|nr:GNAT family N-acetyltransferase [Candidatus Handelsmanbacteria bacterium]